MEGRLSASGDMVHELCCGISNFKGLLQENHQINLNLHQSCVVEPQQVVDPFPLVGSNMPERKQQFSTFQCAKKDETLKTSVCDKETLNAADGCQEGSVQKNEYIWRRVKWTDTMVKLLITAVSYVVEGTSSSSSDGGSPRKGGKWRAVSKVMAYRGYLASPQQCEDKFNDLNKKYKRLNQILGRGTSCKVVENPTLLDSMDISNRAKWNVRKILSSLKCKNYDFCGARSYKSDDLIEDDECPEDENFLGDDHVLHKGDRGTFVLQKASRKRKGQEKEHGTGSLSDTLNSLDCKRRAEVCLPNTSTHMNNDFTEGSTDELQQNRMMACRPLQLEPQKLQIHEQILELDKKQMSCRMFSQQEESELDKLRLQNEYLKLENARLVLALNAKR